MQQVLIQDLASKNHGHLATLKLCLKLCGCPLKKKHTKTDNHILNFAQLSLGKKWCKLTRVRFKKIYRPCMGRNGGGGEVAGLALI